MSIQEIKVPDIGDFSDVDVIEVLVAPGDTLAVDDPMITLESDKASMEVPSLMAGVVKEVKINVGDQVSEGDLVLLLEVDGAVAAAEPTPTASQTKTPEAQPETAATPPALASGGVSFDRVHASPSVPRRGR